MHAIRSIRAAVKPSWMGLRRSSKGILSTLNTSKFLKLGIAAVNTSMLSLYQLYAGKAFERHLG
ncbi:MAG TPA: hypothetical protein DCZ48_08190 [Methylococcaceae bacterium]|nr:hypothetical protein [Methylococcaceae bacterium]